MKKTFALVIVLLSFFFEQLNAQNFNITWEEKGSMKEYFMDAVTLDDGNMLGLRMDMKAGFMKAGSVKYFIQKMDKNSNEILENKLDFEKTEGAIEFIKVKNNIFLICASSRPSSSEVSISARKIDQQKYLPTSSIETGFYNYNEVELTFGSDMKVNYPFSFKLSQDSSKILCFIEKTSKSKLNKKYYLGVFDNQFNKIWDTDIELPIQNKFLLINDYDITNDGKVFVSAKHYDKEVTKESVKEDGRKIPSYSYKLFGYSKENTKGKEIVFSLNDVFINSTKIVYTNVGQLKVVGLYKQKHNGSITGAFYSNINLNTIDAIDTKMIDFDKSIISLVSKDGFATEKESDPGLDPYFEIDYLFNRANGSIDLICEYKRAIRVTTTTNRTGSTGLSYSNSSSSIHYTYGDIIVTNVSKEGNISFTRVPKLQRVADYYMFLGFYPLEYKDKLILIYNDDKDNVEKDITKRVDDIINFKKSVLVAAIIDNNGVLTRKMIADNSDDNYVPTPMFSIKVSDNKHMVSSNLFKFLRRMKTRHGTLEIN